MSASINDLNNTFQTHPNLIQFLPRFAALPNRYHVLITQRLRFATHQRSLTRQCAFCRAFGHTQSRCCDVITIRKILEISEKICEIFEETNYNANQPPTPNNETMYRLYNYLYYDLTGRIISMYCSFAGCNQSNTKNGTVLNISYTAVNTGMYRRQTVENLNGIYWERRENVANLNSIYWEQSVPPSASSVAPPQAAVSPPVATRIPVHIVLPFHIKVTDYVFDPNDEHVCPICYEHLDTELVITTQCNHTFCIDCTNTHFDRVGKKCPLCRADVTSVTASSYECYFNFINRRVL